MMCKYNINRIYPSNIYIYIWLTCQQESDRSLPRELARVEVGSGTGGELERATS